MNANKLGLLIVLIFSAVCVFCALSTGRWYDFMVPATIAVLIGGVFAFNLGRGRDADAD